MKIILDIDPYDVLEKYHTLVDKKLPGKKDLKRQKITEDINDIKGVKISCLGCKKIIPNDVKIIGVPVEYDNINSVPITDGFACSFECAKTHIVENFWRYNIKQSLTLLTLMKKEMTGKIEPIEMTGDWRELKEFGGGLSHDEMRKNRLKRNIGNKISLGPQTKEMEKTYV